MRTIRLEILRPGPSDGQLLSPLTPYIAICDDNPPETFTIPYDHRTLRGRLGRLRYDDQAPAKADDIREAAEIARRVLESIHGFRTTLTNEAKRGDSINVQLVLTAAELALIPFELAYAPLSLNGVAPLSVNSSARVSITRETRHLRGPTLGQWDPKGTRILFVVTAPDGAVVPERAHYYALRKALQPILPKTPSVEDEEHFLTWLRDATLEDVRRECAEKKYTHVHILAHGSRSHDGQESYGLRMHSSTNAGGEWVDGNRLALALQSNSDSVRSTPTAPSVVTLAVCDGGNVGSVILGDASVAHRLHEQEIPMVLASQFPMTFQGSAIFAETFYSELLKGADPRVVLWKVRDALYTRCPETHDWGSVISYATLPKNIATRSEERGRRWEKLELDVRMSDLESRNGKLIDGLAERVSTNRNPELDAIAKRLEHLAERATSVTDANARVDLLSTVANGFKRLSLTTRDGDRRDGDKRALTEKERAFLTRSCRAYAQMFELTPGVPWVLTQSSLAYLQQQSFELDVSVSEVPHLYELAVHLCEGQLHKTTAATDRIDLLAQRIEIELIRLVSAIEKKSAVEQAAPSKGLEEWIDRYVKEIDRWLVGPPRGFRFRLYLEARQFARYSYWWPYQQVLDTVGKLPIDDEQPRTGLLGKLAARDIDVTRYWRLRDE